MDEQRALLDQLLGKARNITDVNDYKKIHFTDKRVCKFYLCGLCPYNLFEGLTKADIGRCPYQLCAGEIEAEECQQEFQQLEQNEKDKYGYEWDLLKILEENIRVCDRRIEGNIRRAEKEAMITDEEVQRVIAINKSIIEFTELCERAAEAGDIDSSLEHINQIEKLKKEKLFLF